MARRQKTVRVPVAMESESRPAAWLRNFRLSGFALSALLLIVCALVVLAPSLKTYVEQRQQIAELQARVDAAQESVDELDGEIARWSDKAYIESQARERFYYVFPGDVNYLTKGGEDEVVTSDGQPISDEIQTTEVDWVRSMMSSIYTAGLTDAPPEELDGPVQLETPGTETGTE
ncbi:MAG: septum formation initiator family protein [Microbacteriaceae bacterium]